MATTKEIKELQLQMANNGFTTPAIAAEIMRRFGHRPRAAWRLARGWSQDDVAGHYNERHGAGARAPMSATRISAFERWPGKGERPSTSTLCRLAELYETAPADLLDPDDLAAVPAADRPSYQALITPRASELTPLITESAASVPYRRSEAESDITHDPAEVMMAAAREGSEHAEQAEQREIGDATLEQFRAEVARLSQAWMSGEPFPLFIEMTRLRARIWAALERRIWPPDQTDLHFLLGILHGLMAAASNSLGNAQAAEELIRTGWAYASTIGHQPLMGWLRLEQSAVVYWERPRQSRELARTGLQYLSEGPHAVELYVRLARAAARLGDTQTASQAIQDARRAHNPDYHDDLLELGGEFTISQATQYSHAGSALLANPDLSSQREAVLQLQQALSLYQAGPAPGEEHFWGSEASARIELATGMARTGELESAVSTLEPILLLPPAKRTDSVLKRLGQLRPALTATRYHGARPAAELDEQIEHFATETIVNDLRELPTGRD